MIVILAESIDGSALQTCEWLEHYGADYLLINDGNNLNPKIRLRQGSSGTQLQYEQKHIESDAVVWYRRGHIKTQALFSSNLDNKMYGKSAKKYIQSENNTLLNYLYFKIKGINHPSRYNANKLITLDFAEKHGFDVPKTLVTNHKEDVIDFKEECEEGLILKNIQDFTILKDEERKFMFKVKKLRDKDIDILPDKFYYSLFQEFIKSKYELRVFHFCGNNYTMVSVDSGHGQHLAPYRLSHGLNARINAFMKDFGLESGSLDILVGLDGKFYFLEVNPVGQYDALNKVCNYHCDKVISEFLMNI